VIGRRTNVLLDKVLLGNDSTSHLFYLPDHVTAAARLRGELFSENAEDFFLIARNAFPWQRVADVVVGRPAYDNYLVGLAIRHNVTVVDATLTVVALHQTDRDGNYAGHANSDSNFNSIRIGPFNYNTGLTTSAQYETRFTVDRKWNRTEVTLVKRSMAQKH